VFFAYALLEVETRKLKVFTDKYYYNKVVMNTAEIKTRKYDVVMCRFNS